MMKKTLIAGAIMTLISTGAIAAKGGKPEPAPDLTPRVEVLESAVDSLNSDVTALKTEVDSIDATNQEQDIRIQGVEETLGYLQPGGGNSGVTKVFVDSTGKVVGVPGENYSEILVKFRGTNSTAKFVIYDNATFVVSASSYYEDSSCGQDGGKHYIRTNNPDSFPPPYIYQPAYAYGGGYTIPKPNPQVSVVGYNSYSFSTTGECRLFSGSTWAVEGFQVDDPGITMPLHIELR